MGIPSDLPPDLLGSVFLYLDEASTKSFQEADPRFKKILTDPGFWKGLHQERPIGPFKDLKPVDSASTYHRNIEDEMFRAALGL